MKRKIRNSSKENNENKGRKKHITVHITFHFKKEILVNHNVGLAFKQRE